MKSSKYSSIQYYNNPDEELMVPPILESWNIEDLDDLLPDIRNISTNEFEYAREIYDSIDQIYAISSF